MDFSSQVERIEEMLSLVTRGDAKLGGTVNPDKLVDGPLKAFKQFYAVAQKGKPNFYFYNVIASKKG